MWVRVINGIGPKAEQRLQAMGIEQVGQLAQADPAAAADPGRVIDYLLRFTLGQAPSHAKDTLREFVQGAFVPLDRERDPDHADPGRCQ